MLGTNIAYYRKEKGMTQEALAQKLDVTNQAVSKWETEQCCPDPQLLPKLADIFGVTMDALFGREAPAAAPELPWEDDDAFHVVVYCGRKLLGSAPGSMKEHTFIYEGAVRDIHCQLNLECGDVAGNVEAGSYVESGDVTGSVTAGGYVECGDVGGDLKAGSYVECGDVGGSLNAASYVECGDVGGGLNAQSYVECGDVEGNVTAGGYVECGDIGGNVTRNDGGGFHFRF